MANTRSTIAGLVFVFICAFAMCARAESPLAAIRQYKPIYVMTHYSDGEWWEKDNTPYIKSQISFAVPALREPKAIKGVEFIPELAFTWTAHNWPIGKESSPIEENNYAPEIFLHFSPGDTSGTYRGFTTGWLHTSTGTDSTSGSWDRMQLEMKFAQGDWLYIYVQGWYVMAYGMETEPIKFFANFSNIEDFGGQVRGVVNFDMLRLAATLGLSWQNIEAFVPLQESYNLYLYGQFHNGNVASLNRYAERETSGGVGVALLR